MSHPATIFISIASYRDPDLLFTLKDMLQHAARPENLHIAICWQDHEDLQIFEMAGLMPAECQHDADRNIWSFHYRQARIDIISVHYYNAQGACWARSLAESLYDNETWFLQIDSHCRFIPAWDNEMIAILQQLQASSARPILSSYPPAFRPGDNEEASKKQYVSRIIFREFDSQQVPMFSSTPFDSPAPVRGSYIAGGFIFTSGEFVRTVPNDPQIFFAGEEIAMAVRAFTHGYDIYHPHKPLLWHYYQRKEQHKVWGDHTNEAKSHGAIEKAWWERDSIAKKRVRAVLGLETEIPGGLAPYTTGSKRSLREFEYQAGICLQSGTVLPEVVGKEKVNFFATPPADEAEWLSRMRTHYRKIITLSESDCIPQEGKLEDLHISVFNAQNTLMHKRTLKSEELAALRTSSTEGELKLTLEFNTTSHSKPSAIRVCPWSITSGWGVVREEAW